MIKLQTKQRNEDEQWISVSDMMAGLMMIFLFISIIYIQNISRYFSAVSDVNDEICGHLRQEFEDETDRWDMSICESGLIITFDNDSNFEINSAELSNEFTNILSDFYPRLMKVVYEYQDSISELRIEGHTDSSVRPTDNQLTGYLYNTRLSQERSRNVMDYSLNLNSISGNKNYMDWSYAHVTAHGLSSSKKIVTGKGDENFAASRRVEFRLRTEAEERLMELVAEIKDYEN
ncbi:MAG: OmpA family protein [Rhodobacteraceae bacterium]|nr:OmpA family protein [Paracoccaceae bacterium]